MNIHLLRNLNLTTIGTLFRKGRKINAYQNALVEQHYAEIENIYRTMRGWRHDWHNHIQALSAQLDSGEYERQEAIWTKSPVHPDH